MKTESYKWKANQHIVEHYMNDFAKVKALYEYDPWVEHVCEERRQWLADAEHLRVDRTALCEVLTRYNKRIFNDDQALVAIDSLASEDTLAVVGGQQAGLFSGPMLVIYKAITIIQLAERESKRLGCAVVPVFWIAGEDHDIAEVDHTYIMTQEHELNRIALDVHTDSNTMVSELHIEAEKWQQCLTELDRSLLNTEFKAEIMTRLHLIADQSQTLTDFTARLLAWLFGSYGLIIMDAADPILRRIEGPMFKQLIEHSERINEALIHSKQTMNALGYTEQADVREQQANLFVIDHGERKLLFHTDDGYRDRRSTVHFTKSDLLKLAESSPELLSNNVFTRPLMQEYLFPTLHTVLGPGEIAYWGLLKGVFHTVGMKMPIISPRYSYTLVEGVVHKHMVRYGLSFHDVVHALDEKREAWLESQDELQLMDQFTEVKAKFAGIYQPLIAQLGHINQGLQQLGETNEEKIVQQIDFLQTRAYRALQQQHKSALRHFDRIALSITPLGKPQERVYNMIAYLNKYGRNWIDELVRLQVPDDKQHTIVYL